MGGAPDTGEDGGMKTEQDVKHRIMYLRMNQPGEEWALKAVEELRWVVG